METYEFRHNSLISSMNINSIHYHKSRVELLSREVISHGYAGTNTTSSIYYSNSTHSYAIIYLKVIGIAGVHPCGIS